MNYKELVDDIQIQFKSHNESIKTQNPYWILFRLLTEINAIRDELLQKITQASDVPEWMVSTSTPLQATTSNSGGNVNNFDDYKFSLYLLPDYYPIFPENSILEVHSSMRQTEIYLEKIKDVMLRIRAEDENLQHFVYGFVVTNRMYLYPAIDAVYVRYVPRYFCSSFDNVVVTETIPAPDFIVEEARKRVVESVILQKQIPEDNFPDGKDQPAATPKQ